MAATGFTPIKIYASSTASAVPLAANLDNTNGAELAINTADGRLFYKDSAGNVQTMASKATGAIGGSTTQVQFNNAGVLGGSASLTWSGTVLTSSGFSGPLNGTVGATTPAAGSFTTLTSSSDATLNGLTVGRGAGAVATNTAVGASALSSNTSGANSVAVGYRAAFSNTSGDSNTFIGSDSAYTNTTGSFNVSIGKSAFVSNSTGANNTATGAQALYSNTTAGNNTAVGYQAGYSNTTGANLVAIGQGTLYSNTTGSDNCAVGAFNTLSSNTTGIQNSAFARGALGGNTTGNYNSAFGYQALLSNTTASNNTAVGYQAGYSNTTGGFNVFVGYRAGYTSNFNGNAYNACVGWASGYSLTTGVKNTFVGGGDGARAAGGAITTGSSNTIIGTYNGNYGGLDIRTASNYIVLSDGDGNPRQVIDNNGRPLFGAVSAFGSGFSTFAYLGATYNGISVVQTDNSSASRFMNFAANGASCGVIDRVGATSAVVYTATSDYRLKNVTGAVTGQGARIDALKPIDYQWKEDNSHARGFLAHEFQTVYPNSVTGTKDALDKDGNPKYQAIQASSSEVIADLVAEIQSLRKRLADAGL